MNPSAVQAHACALCRHMFSHGNDLHWHKVRQTVIGSADEVFGADIAAGGVDVDVQLERQACLSQPPMSPMPYTHYQYSDHIEGEG